MEAAGVDEKLIMLTHTLQDVVNDITLRLATLYSIWLVDPDSPVIIILATGSEVRGFKPVRGRWIFLERKNPEYDFLRKGSKAVGPYSGFTARKTTSSRN